MACNLHFSTRSIAPDLSPLLSKVGFDYTMDNRGKKLSSAKKLKACRRRELSKEDGLCGLPNEIIVDILSLLTLKEAGQTSVLSKRWKYVSAYVPVLYFDASDAIYKIDSGETSFEVETPLYLNWVNQVVGSYRGTAIDEFRVRFLLDNDDTDSIDNWLNFAIKKRVKKLEFNFSGVNSNHYTFCNVLSGCNSLTSLQLASVSITGDIVQNLLKACSALEYLSVKYSNILVSLEVTEETPNLKYLELLCYWVERMEINAPNLVSFKYYGRIINVPFAKIPKLTQLFVGGSYCNDVVRNLLRFSSHLCQLEALTLDLTYLPGALQISFDQFPVCAKLKQLELITYPVIGSPLCYIPIIKACPFLHKFVVKLKHYKVDKRRKLLQVEAYPHHHLKIIEVCGFVECAPHIEFTRYLMKSCVALDKIIIDPRHPLYVGTPGEFLQGKKMKEARKKAEKKLRPFLNPGVDFVII